MITGDQLRTQLLSATEAVDGGPDLETSLSDGRRRRRRARAGAGAATLALVAGSVAAAAALTGGHSPDVVREPLVAETPWLPQEFVAGTDIDERIQVVVDRHLPGRHAAEVYPSDWTRDTPLPDEQFSNATDWQARYVIASTESLSLIMGYPERPPYAEFVCPPGPGDGAPRCRIITTADGGSLMTAATALQPGFRRSPSELVVGAYYTPADRSFVVAVYDKVRSESWPEADSVRQVGLATLGAIATDPDLRFPPPEVPPTR